MKVGQKLYYVDISGRVITYIVTEVKENGVKVAWEEDSSISTVFTKEEADRLIAKYNTIEAAQEYAEKRRANIKSNQMGE